jgi:hypothetical protein
VLAAFAAEQSPSSALSRPWVLLVNRAPTYFDGFFFRPSSHSAKKWDATNHLTMIDLEADECIHGYRDKDALPRRFNAHVILYTKLAAILFVESESEMVRNK